ncbi:unnamed protein product [Phytophthora lilii]|uniref:Unnamed protein product n=1 Tax=Phytophthora lilii TaxID=2077276 RepID=A0A9W6X6D7_9STRA|nr:unnamed protein product [Phytophthora lilii]
MIPLCDIGALHCFVVAESGTESKPTIREKSKKERFDEQSWNSLKSSPYYDILREHRDVLPDEIPAELPTDKGVQHEIDLVPGTKYCVTRQWPLPRDQVKAIDDFLESRRKAGHERESKPPNSAPTFCVKKPQGGWRIVHASNKQNDATIPAQTPIPRKDVIIDPHKADAVLTDETPKHGYLVRPEDALLQVCVKLVLAYEPKQFAEMHPVHLDIRFAIHSPAVDEDIIEVARREVAHRAQQMRQASVESCRGILQSLWHHQPLPQHSAGGAHRRDRNVALTHEDLIESITQIKSTEDGALGQTLASTNVETLSVLTQASTGLQYRKITLENPPTRASELTSLPVMSWNRFARELYDGRIEQICILSDVKRMKSEAEELKQITEI